MILFESIGQDAVFIHTVSNHDYTVIFLVHVFASGQCLDFIFHGIQMVHRAKYQDQVEFFIRKNEIIS